MKFCFDETAIEEALLANGWVQLWHEDNWVFIPNENPDHAGMSMKSAFEMLMRDNNLAPDNMKDFWIVE